MKAAPTARVGPLGDEPRRARLAIRGAVQASASDRSSTGWQPSWGWRAGSTILRKAYSSRSKAGEHAWRNSSPGSKPRSRRAAPSRAWKRHGSTLPDTPRLRFAPAAQVARKPALVLPVPLRPSKGRDAHHGKIRRTE